MTSEPILKKRPTAALVATVAVVAALAACSTPQTPTGEKPTTPVSLVSKVDLKRYMGDWYVIANIPTKIEESAFNSKETYTLEEDDKIDTVFSFNEGSFTGPQKTYHSKGRVLDTQTNAVWGEQYVWPINADYRISYLSSNYTQVVVTREKRDYVWVMARTPTISDADYQRLSAVVAREGYDASKLRKVPQASGK